MSNRRFEMYEYRQVIHRMRMGESDRSIAGATLMRQYGSVQILRIGRVSPRIFDLFSANFEVGVYDARC